MTIKTIKRERWRKKFDHATHKVQLLERAWQVICVHTYGVRPGGSMCMRQGERRGRQKERDTLYYLTTKVLYSLTTIVLYLTTIVLY